MDFCDRYNCSECCLDAKVPLLNEDVNRITRHGYYDAYFVDENNGIKTLRTRDDGSCIFYNPRKGACEIYNSRPERCRLNPYCICKDNLEPHVAETCVHISTCREEPDKQTRMAEYLVNLQKEISWRRRTGHF